MRNVLAETGALSAVSFTRGPERHHQTRSAPSPFLSVSRRARGRSGSVEITHARLALQEIADEAGQVVGYKYGGTVFPKGRGGDRWAILSYLMFRESEWLTVRDIQIGIDGTSLGPAREKTIRSRLGEVRRALPQAVTVVEPAGKRYNLFRLAAEVQPSLSS